MKSKYEDLFETSIGKEFDVRLNDLQKQILQIKKSYEKTYSKEVEIARKEIKHDNSLKFLNMKIAELTAKRNKSIRDDEEIKNISSKIESLRVEREDAKKEFVRLNKQKSSNNWKMLVTRTVAPQVLELLEKNPNGMTEVSVVNEVLGDESEKLTSQQRHNRYCMVLYYMENLGWVKREGSGKPYEPKNSFLTELGKKQLETYRTCKKFDKNLQ